MSHFHEYRGHDEVPRVVSLPAARRLDTRSAPRAEGGKPAPRQRFDLHKWASIVATAVCWLAGIAVFILVACHVVQIGGTALRGAW